jgi:hypothetical protein
VNGDSIPLASSSVRARARPRAVIGVWAWETALSLMGSLPAVALVRSAYGRHPRGDAPLWDAGALPLLGLLSREANGVRAATTTAAVALLLGATLGLVPMAALMVSISTATRDGRAIGGAQTAHGALRVLRPLAVLLLVVGLGQGVVVGCAFLLGAGAQSWAHRSLGEALAQQLALALGAAVMLGAVALGVTQDLARAAVVRFELGAMRALGVGASALRHAPFAVSWSWAWRTAASAAPIVAVAWLADRIGGRGGVALVVLAALHQCVILARVALRASWLAKAIRTVDGLAPAIFAIDGLAPDDRLVARDEAIEAADHLGASDR